MSEHPFPEKYAWYASANEEDYAIGPCETREEAIEEAISQCLGEYEENGEYHYSFHVAECQETNIDLANFFDVSDWLERAAEDMDENECGSDMYGKNHPINTISDDQEKDLDACIKAAIREWQKRNNLPLRSYWFSHVRNSEHVSGTYEKAESSQ